MVEKLHSISALERAGEKLRRQLDLYNLACQPGSYKLIAGKNVPHDTADVLDRAIREMDEKEINAFNEHLRVVSKQFGSGGP